MQARSLSSAPERTYALVFEHGDQVMTTLERFAAKHALTASRLSAIGAFEQATLGYFDWQRKEYERIPVDQQVEVLSLTGDVTLEEGRPKLHVHCVLGKRDGSTVGGHLIEARVRPTLEVLLIESPGHLQRRHDPESGLALIRFDEGQPPVDDPKTP